MERYNYEKLYWDLLESWSDIKTKNGCAIEQVNALRRENEELKAKLDKAKWQPISNTDLIKVGYDALLLIDGYSKDAWITSARFVNYPKGADWDTNVKPLNITHHMPRPDAPEQP